MNEKTKTAWERLTVALGQIENQPHDSEAKVRTSGGSEYSYGFTSLPKILAHVREVFGKNGLGITQEDFTLDGVPACVTKVICEDGILYETKPLVIEAAGFRMNDVQAVGATMTYLKRYQLSAVAGLASEADTDATDNAIGATRSPSDQSKGTGSGISEKQKKMIWAKAQKIWPEDTQGAIANYCRMLEIPTSSAELSKKQASKLIEGLIGLETSTNNGEDLGY